MYDARFPRIVEDDIAAPSRLWSGRSRRGSRTHRATRRRDGPGSVSSSRAAPPAHGGRPVPARRRRARTRATGRRPPADRTHVLHGRRLLAWARAALDVESTTYRSWSSRITFARRHLPVPSRRGPSARPFTEKNRWSPRALLAPLQRAGIEVGSAPELGATPLRRVEPHALGRARGRTLAQEATTWERRSSRIPRSTCCAVANRHRVVREPHHGEEPIAAGGRIHTGLPHPHGARSDSSWSAIITIAPLRERERSQCCPPASAAFRQPAAAPTRGPLHRSSWSGWRTRATGAKTAKGWSSNASHSTPRAQARR